MSRHAIPGLHPHYEVHVGWDPPLQTFFASVLDHTIPDDHTHERCVRWTGTREGQLPTLDALAQALAPYAILPARVRALLLAEQAVPYEHSPLQKHMLRLLRRIHSMP